MAPRKKPGAKKATRRRRTKDAAAPLKTARRTRRENGKVPSEFGAKMAAALNHAERTGDVGETGDHGDLGSNAIDFEG